MQSNEFDLQRARELAGTDAARQLMEMLRQSDPQQLQKVLASAAGGDFRQAQQDLSGLLRDPKAQKLLKELGR